MSSNPISPAEQVTLDATTGIANNSVGVVSRDLTPDERLLIKAHTIMSCNDPGQPVVLEIEMLLKLRGVMDDAGVRKEFLPLSYFDGVNPWTHDWAKSSFGDDTNAG